MNPEDEIRGNTPENVGLGLEEGSLRTRHPLESRLRGLMHGGEGGL